MTYNELYHEAVRLLSSSLEGGQLFSHVTNKRVTHLAFLGENESPAKEAELLYRLSQRRVGGEPLQYLLGEWEFYSLPMRVGPGVLIPRADTETLVDVALERIRAIETPEILDLCSGTGCVAIALAHERGDARVTALELAGDAFRYLLENIELNAVAVKPVRHDLMDYTHPRPLDLVTANPPYIPEKLVESLQKEVLHEPRLALDGGKDGLDFYRAIVRLYAPRIKPGGSLCLEVGVGQSEQVSRILEKQGFTEIGVREDYGGIPRVVYGIRAIPAEGGDGRE